MPDTQRLRSLPVEMLVQELKRREDNKDARHAIAAPEDQGLADFDDGTLWTVIQEIQHTIYGQDNRQDLFQLPPGANLSDADSVVAIFRGNFLTDNGDGNTTIITNPFGTSQNLCSGEPFFNQPSAGPGIKGTGFLVYSDLVATAAHLIVLEEDLPYYHFVFGFRMRDATRAETVINNGQIYRGVSFVGRELADGKDWLLIRLDRRVDDHRFARIRRSGKVNDGQGVHVIGHPRGLTAKFAGGANIRDNAPEPLFVANLDVYAGSSGSPVFNSDTHQVEGIVSRGELDFVPVGNCNRSLICPDTGCSGEWCSRTIWFAELVPTPLVRRSAQYGTPPAIGSPTACVIPGLGVHNIAYRDTSGMLHELWRDAAGATGTTNLTAAAGAPAAAGNPYAYVDTSRNTEILLFRDSNGTVRSLYWSTGPVGHDNLGGTAGAPGADGDPVGYYVSAVDMHHVIYRTANGHLHELWWSGVESVQYGGDLTDLASAPAALGQPSAFVNGNGDNIVVYRGSDGHIRSLYWTTGDVAGEDLSGVAGTPSAAGDPIAYYTAHDNTHQVVYLGTDGHWWELFWQGNAPVVGWDLTAISCAPVGVTAPAAYYSAGTNTKHVIYVSADGRLHDVRWTPGAWTPMHRDVTDMAEAPLAGDRPTAFTIEGPNWHHVAYRGLDGQIYEVIW